MTDAGNATPDGGLRAVILVPRRDGFPDRDALWAFTKPWWRETFPDWPLFEGHHDIGLFNRSAAVNAAAKAAGDWDVAVVIDSDVLTDPAQVRAAVPVAIETGQMVVPFLERHNVNPRGTKRIVAGERGSWRGFIARTYRDQHSSVIVIPRTLWDDIGGFDEGFKGWGMEDTAFALACEVFAGRKLERLPGEVWHLHHATPPGEKHGTPSHRANLERLGLYRAAHSINDRAAMSRLTIEGRETPAVMPDGIPRILHRTVPAETSPDVERWWQQWEALHPGWRMMTWRDPLDPADFPQTSPLWRKVTSGAQLADLVRLEVLWRHGGVYVDSDVEPYRSLEPLVSLQAFAAWEDPKVVPNAVLGARPEHPAIRECLDLARRLIRLNPERTWHAGPGVTTRVLPNRADVLLLPPGSFYPYHYRDAKTLRGRDFREEQPWAFGAHHWHGSWLPEDKRW